MRSLSLIVLLCASLFAHKVNLFGELSGDSLYLNGYFAGGGACRACEIIVRDGKGEILLQDKLDDSGELNAVIPGTASVDIEMDAFLGHKAVIHLENSTVSRQETQMHNESVNLPVQKPEELEWEKVLYGFLFLFGIFGVIWLGKRRQ